MPAIHLYKCPGSYTSPQGVRYQVCSVEEGEKREGWYSSLKEAALACGESCLVPTRVDTKSAKKAKGLPYVAPVEKKKKEVIDIGVSDLGSEPIPYLKRSELSDEQFDAITDSLQEDSSQENCKSLGLQYNLHHKTMKKILADVV